jgi:hypothetical protein
VIFRACQLVAALGLVRRLGRGRRPRPPLTGDPDLAEIIVVEDESSERTAAEGEEHGAAVLAGRALPPGSAVKWWALDQGLRAARRDLVLFLDANNLPRPVVTRPPPSTAPAAHRESQ